jgi:hypothetical protein
MDDRPRDSEYDRDFYAWTQRQAELVRELPRLVRGLPNAVDIENLSEEIADLGRSELTSVRSLTLQILIHLIKAASRPTALPRRKWLAECLTFQADMRLRFTPGMRQQVDIDALWREARRVAKAELKLRGVDIAPTIPSASPFAFDELLADDFSPGALASRVAGSATPPP